MVEKEEERIATQRLRLRNLRNELRLKELSVLEAARDKALKERTRRREDALNRLVEDISKKVRFNHKEIQVEWT